MTSVLVVEDDAQTSAEIELALRDYGFEVDCVADGRAGIHLATAKPYDAIVLDRMLPGDLDGLSVLAAFRDAGIEAPVLILSALSALDERVRGLRAGGDDYLTKPFEFLELTARLDVLMRRAAQHRNLETRRSVSDLEIDLITRQVRRGGKLIELLPREYRLLDFLMRHAGQVVTRTMLMEEVWGFRSGELSNVIDVHVGKLRRKLDQDGKPSLIHTIRGSGYTLRAPH